MNNRQTKIFYLVVLLIILFFYAFWSFFLKDRWQANEVSVIDLKTCQLPQEPQRPEIQPPEMPMPDEVLAETPVIAEPVSLTAQEELKAEPPEGTSWGNHGYTTKDGQSTYAYTVKYTIKGENYAQTNDL